ncbi:MAG: phenylalanine--tRNA ligase subunit beta [Candidatus Cloacimonadota bacterium]|nr:MAG: phenylalanine--tRNA ligase subunit beta [Candidatus Cloacimonadota bacterium]
MKVSIEWLKEFVDIDISIDELARRLTEQGVSVEGVEQIGEDYVLDLEITPNRPDLLSVFGIAREIKAMLGKENKKNPFRITEEVRTTGSNIRVKIENFSDCPRYTGCSIENIELGSSPDWIKRRLEIMGIRSLNNVVDVTNYILLEMGHPLHAFDSECIKGNKINVRRAKEGESIVTLDGETRKLDSDFLVIADSEKPIALAGIMGGEKSEIKNETRNIFIESAFFSPTLIRKGAKRLNISTESSYRFERKADINSLIPALLRTNELIIKFCSGEMKGGITDIYKKEEEEKKKVFFSIEWLNGFLGSNLSRKEIIEPLTALDLNVKGNTSLEVEIPSFRRDIGIKEDIAEEVIRMVGFDSIPSSNKITFEKVGSIPENSLKINKIKNYFVSLGYDEVVNISFVSNGEINTLKIGKEPAVIQNPITSNLTHLRPTLIIGLLKTMKKNISIGIRDVRIFELGNTFVYTSQGKIDEPLRISGAISGHLKNHDWRAENRRADYYDLKGDIEGLFDVSRIKDVRFEKKEGDFAFLIEGSNIYIENDKVGFIGSLSKEIRDKFDLLEKVFLFEIELAPLLTRISFDYKFKPFPRFPAVLRDLCLLVPENVTHHQIEKIIKNSGKKLVEGIQLFDTYYNKKFSPGLRSFTYSLTFRSNNETLNDARVNATVEEILQSLDNGLGIKLRGEE